MAIQIKDFPNGVVEGTDFLHTNKSGLDRKTTVTLLKDYIESQITYGSVNSVDVAVPTGLSSSGGPITDSGVITLSFTAGYSIPTNTKQANWDEAYGWGDHALAGYIPSTDIASDSDIFSGTADKVIDADNLYSANAVVTSSGTGSWAPDFKAGRKFQRTLTGASTLANPTNQVAGQEGYIYVIQDGTGGHTLAYGSEYNHVGVAGDIKLTANAVNMFAYYVRAVGEVDLNYIGELV